MTERLKFRTLGGAGPSFLWQGNGNGIVLGPNPTDPPPDTLWDRARATGSVALSAALVYHGYRRSNSVLSAVLWGWMGSWFPFVAAPIALAQGFGQRKKEFEK